MHLTPVIRSFDSPVIFNLASPERVPASGCVLLENTTVHGGTNIVFLRACSASSSREPPMDSSIFQEGQVKQELALSGDVKLKMTVESKDRITGVKCICR